MLLGKHERKFTQILENVACLEFFNVVRNRGINFAAELAEAPPSPPRVSAKAHTAEAATFLELYRKVSYPEFFNRAL